jgi:hypothetical protein
MHNLFILIPSALVQLHVGGCTSNAEIKKNRDHGYGALTLWQSGQSTAPSVIYETLLEVLHKKTNSSVTYSDS